ncbi:MAG: histidine kinase [Mesorhizobium sp.]|nr:histidine kinase [Mesorhizobium sp.]MBN9272475.1 histidine kinase [Mesorhizobium sp.]
MNSDPISRRSHAASRNGGGARSQGETGAQLGRAVTHALRNAGAAVLYQDRDLKPVWGHNLLTPWAGGADEGESALPPAQAERVASARRNVLATGDPERFEISVPGDDGLRWFDIWVDADIDEKGEMQGIVTTRVETTEQKRREQTLRTLLREVSHRSKNLLAIIQSIASQTGRYSESIADFLTRFRGRLQSLSSSQDLVTSSNWRGAQLRELVAGQVGRYGSDPAVSLHFEGANPLLNPNAALHIGLAMHELAVNSVSYGALSRPSGFVEVNAAMFSDTQERPSLSLVWREKIPPREQRGNLKRFGSIALERVVPASLNGTATLEIEGERLEYSLVVPHGNFETD